MSSLCTAFIPAVLRFFCTTETSDTPLRQPYLSKLQALPRCLRMRSSSRYRIHDTEHLRQGPYVHWIVRMKSNAGRRRLPYMPTSYFQQIVPTVLSKKRLCQEGTLVSSERCDVPGRNLATPAASPSPHLTSSPPTRRPSIQNPQPPSPAVQSSAIHFPQSSLQDSPRPQRTPQGRRA